MGAALTGAIGPVSVRYAAQIRELLFAQAIQRMAADQEAARAQSQAERAARVEPASKPEPGLQAVHTRTTSPEPVSASEPVAETAPETKKPTAQLVDIQA
jgi:hypothetical protein